MSAPPQDGTSGRAPGSARRRMRRNRWLRWAVYGFYVLLVFECAARLFWAVDQDQAFLSPRFVERMYPEVVPVKRAVLEANDERFDVLLLGGSVLHEDWGTVGPALGRQLAQRIDRPIRIHNVATEAHTSLDSLCKYEYLADQPFDAVVVYHGINEARFNNCPPQRFEDDYSHTAWYRHVNVVRRHPERRLLVLPYTVDYMLAGRRDDAWAATFSPPAQTASQWLQYGAEIKTDEPFERNLERIVRLARANGHAIVLCTFAYYVPEDYSLQRFKRAELDYGTHNVKIGVWGRPEHVTAAIDAHNQVVVDLARRHEAVLVDQESLIDDSGRMFDDICHLTEAGSERFASNLVEALAPLSR